MPRKKKAYSTASRIADAVGVANLILGTLLIFLGEVTDLFSWVALDHGGVTFVFHYLCAPVYLVLSPYLPGFGDPVSILIAGLLVVVGSSVLYGLITYLLMRLLFSLLGVRE